MALTLPSASLHSRATLCAGAEAPPAPLALVDENSIKKFDDTGDVALCTEVEQYGGMDFNMDNREGQLFSEVRLQLPPPYVSEA